MLERLQDVLDKAQLDVRRQLNTSVPTQQEPEDRNREKIA